MTNQVDVFLLLLQMPVVPIVEFLSDTKAYLMGLERHIDGIVDAQAFMAIIKVSKDSSRSF